MRNVGREFPAQALPLYLLRLIHQNQHRAHDTSIPGHRIGDQMDKFIVHMKKGASVLTLQDLLDHLAEILRPVQRIHAFSNLRLPYLEHLPHA